MFEIMFELNDFKKFLSDNKVIGTVIGVIVAYSAWDLIQSLVGDIILPSIYFLIFQRINPKYTNGIFEPMNKLNIPNFIKELLSFVMVLFVAFTVIYQILSNKILDIVNDDKNNDDKNNDDDKKPNFLLK
jgi:large-conductance mechanosensitive channel